MYQCTFITHRPNFTSNRVKGLCSKWTESEQADERNNFTLDFLVCVSSSVAIWELCWHYLLCMHVWIVDVSGRISVIWWTCLFVSCVMSGSLASAWLLKFLWGVHSAAIAYMHSSCKWQVMMTSKVLVRFEFLQFAHHQDISWHCHDAVREKIFGVRFTIVILCNWVQQYGSQWRICNVY